jgi:hypothetical protein
MALYIYYVFLQLRNYFTVFPSNIHCVCCYFSRLSRKERGDPLITPSTPPFATEVLLPAVLLFRKLLMSHECNLYFLMVDVYLYSLMYMSCILKLQTLPVTKTSVLHCCPCRAEGNDTALPETRYDQLLLQVLLREAN